MKNRYMNSVLEKLLGTVIKKVTQVQVTRKASAIKNVILVFAFQTPQHCMYADAFRAGDCWSLGQVHK